VATYRSLSRRDEVVLSGRRGLAPRARAAGVGRVGRGCEGGLLALSVGVRLSALEELMAEEVDDVVVRKGRCNLERPAVRPGH
jgi:hypothetical protein